MKMTFRLSPDLAERLRVEAAERGINLDDLLTEALVAYFNREQAEEPERKRVLPFPVFKGGHRATADEEVTPERLHEVLYGSGKQ